MANGQTRQNRDRCAHLCVRARAPACSLLNKIYVYAIYQHKHAVCLHLSCAVYVMVARLSSIVSCVIKYSVMF